MQLHGQAAGIPFACIVLLSIVYMPCCCWGKEALMLMGSFRGRMQASTKMGRCQGRDRHGGYLQADIVDEAHHSVARQLGRHVELQPVHVPGPCMASRGLKV